LKSYPRNHRQLTPDRSRGREFLLVRVAQRQHRCQIASWASIPLRGVRRGGQHDAVDERTQDVAGFGLDAIVVQRQLELAPLRR
jgi:hypothetical protein